MSPSFLKGGLLLVEGVVLRVKIELALSPSRLHPVIAIDRQSPSMSVTCTYVQKVQDKSSGHLACKALYPSSILGAASKVWGLIRGPFLDQCRELARIHRAWIARQFHLTFHCHST